MARVKHILELVGFVQQISCEATGGDCGLRRAQEGKVNVPYKKAMAFITMTSIWHKRFSLRIAHMCDYLFSATAYMYVHYVFTLYIAV